MAVALFGVAFLVLILFLAQSVLTLQRHGRLIDSTLEDFAGFAADGVVAELNSRFATIFLDQISVSRAAHYAWLAGDDDDPELPRARFSLPDGAIPLHFSLVDGVVVTRGGTMDAATAAWIGERVETHAREIYPAPAPYALLHTKASGSTRTVVYRREQAYEGVAVFGFLVDFTALGPVYASVLDDARMLPQSMAHDVRPADILSVTLAMRPFHDSLYTRPGPGSTEVIGAAAYAAKAGRISVRVDLDAKRARDLVSGPSAQQVPIFTGLAVLTLALLLFALILVRRAARLTRMREVFVENVSHDLRTPLAQIRMFSETLLLARMEDPDERRRSLEIIRRQALHLSDLVDGVLYDSTREQAGPRPASTHLGELLRSVLEGLEPAAAERDVTLVGHTSGTEEANVDPGALRRILTNLVDNALKYGPRGQTVSLRISHLEGRVEVAVEDQGPGVPKVERTRVWERLYRLRNTDRGVTGAGIGLSVVRQLAERHGGTVRLTQPSGGGARVTVTLAT